MSNMSIFFKRIYIYICNEGLYPVSVRNGVQIQQTNFKYIYIYLSLSLSIYLSVCLSIYLPTYLSIYLPTSLSLPPNACEGL